MQLVPRDGLDVFGMVNGGAVVADETESQHPRHSAQELERRQRTENHLRPAKFAGRVGHCVDRRRVGQHQGNLTETYDEQPMEKEPFTRKGMVKVIGVCLPEVI